MSLPSNGITADVIRDIMPQYQLSADLLDATFRALPPPPRDASAAWRHKHIKRLIGEITALKPADAGQARTAAQVLSLRELADVALNRAYLPEVTLPQLCRLGRTAAELVRTAGSLVRGLEQTQQKPVPFYGTVVQDEVDIAAVDQIWCSGASVPAGAGSARGGDGDARPDLAAGPLPHSVVGADPAVPLAGVSEDGLAAMEGESRDGLVVTQQDSADSPDAAESGIGGSFDAAEGGTEDGPAAAAGKLGDSLAAADMGHGNGPVVTAGRHGPDSLPRSPGSDGGPTYGSVVTRLEQGPGWTLDVVRRRTREAAGAEAALGASA